MKALPWCSSSTEALTLTCGLTRRPESRELGEYKKIVSTKASFFEEKSVTGATVISFILPAIYL